MYFLYIFSVGLSLGYIFFKRRSFDFFSVSIICSFLYTYPLIFKRIFDPEKREFVEIFDVVYLVYGLFNFFSVGFALFFDYKYRSQGFSSSCYVRCNNVFYLLFLIVFSLLFLMVVVDPNFLFDNSGPKADINQFGPIFPFFIWGSLALVAIAMNNGSRIQLLYSMAFVAISLMAGIRSYFVTSLIVIIIFYFFSYGRFRLGFKFSYVFMGIFLVFFMIVFKVVLHDLRAFDFEGAVASLTDVDSYLYRIFSGSESNVIMSNVNGSFIYIDKYNAGDYSEGVFFRIFPFVSNELASIFGTDLVRFSEYLKGLLFSSVNYGVGASLFAEFAFIGGFPLVYLSTFVLPLLIYIVNFTFYRRRNLYVVFLMPLFVYFSFYFHRLELAFLIYVFYVLTFYFLAIIVIHGVLFVYRRPFERMK